MKRAINNIQLIRIPVRSGVVRYYLPHSTSFAAKPINRIIALNPEVAGRDESGSPIVPLALDGYITLRGKADNEILKDVPLQQLYQSNNSQLVAIDSLVDWETSYISFPALATLQNVASTVLLYVIYDGYQPVSDKYSVIRTVEFPAGANTTLSDITDSRLYGTLKKIDYTGADTSSVYITLNCTSGRTLNAVNTNLLSTFTEDPKVQDALYLANYDVDYNNSYINNLGATPGKLILYYE